MTMRVVFLAFFVFLLGLQSAESVSVECEEQQEVCECEQGESECEFTLIAEELQTFTSYMIDASGNELTRGTSGSTYFLNATGYHPTVPGSSSCAISSPLMTDTDFRNFQTDDEDQNRCSIPMTVDGDTYRLFIAVNGLIPGPTLIMDEGALVRVTLENRLASEGITIHWHGMHQRGTPWMDGVGFISQAPITPGATFDYVFKATPPGTHWYHSHVGAQRTDGLFGALIVREANSSILQNDIRRMLTMNMPNQYDAIVDSPGSHTLTLLDWQREASVDLFIRIHSSLRFYYRNPATPESTKPIGAVPTDADFSSRLHRPTVSVDGIEVGPVPYWSGLINGRGRLDASFPAPLSVFPVNANEAYRFRIVGAQSLYAYSFSIDNHKLRVIASDGHFIRPVDVDYLIVHSGERYDIVIETFNKSQLNHWIRAETLEVLEPGVEHSARAILTYEAGDIALRRLYDSSVVPESPHSCTEESRCDVLNCPFLGYPSSAYRNCTSLNTLMPFSPLLASFNQCDNPSDCTLFLNFGFEGISLTSAINGRNFQLPVAPYQTTCGRYDDDRGSCARCTGGSDNVVDCRCIHVESIMKNRSLISMM